jgi:23S rRNA (cytidine1920-2'-O)/16S rRNA (cytidine1409-2'-O)-methyltransferase
VAAPRRGDIVTAQGERLDLEMVRRGLAESRERAQGLILAGAVTVAGRSGLRASQRISIEAEIRVRAPEHPFVGRGGVKLAAALDAFHVDPAGLVALDVGASTGGFTDCLLQRGAARVYAVDVGYGQLAWRLRQDTRVVALERCNARYLNPTHIPEQIHLAVIDVSFISLALILPAVARLLGPDAVVVALLKPQFEIGKGKLGKGGVLRDQQARRGTVESVRRQLEKQGWSWLGEIESPIAGQKGNREYLIKLQARGRTDLPLGESAEQV